MQYFPKKKAVLSLVLSSLILLAFMLFVTPNTINNISAVEVNGVEVYWDSNYINRVVSIDWGPLTPGSVKNIVLYIRNEVEEPIDLTMSTTNWNPSKASNYITLRWNYAGQRMNPGETLQITLTLSVSRNIEEISSFSFEILITGSDSLLGDISGDGIVDILDLLLCVLAYGSRPADPNWNPRADLYNDGLIDIFDLLMMVYELWKTMVN